ncbi:tubulin nucleotide-binding domain-like protein [Dendrothele bispora CBS 962.96]|uniref:Tubulin nucleotide-binding domain-like protein n=1 Tax=Dendrothele bispora (strain CBS 962.96) TaxID=1314807 RepID=A0A4S8LP34_DENBC|nr:tubulin nucleotide-binding domain-like protein [Dendrothele bispora CBS 962.96]
MREILYIQAGTFANYVGTHFWNTQEAYFTYAEEDEPFVCHDISFREGLNDRGESTYCPRLLVFDRKANYGALARTNSSLFGNEASNHAPNIWNGPVTEYKQTQVPENPYQTQLSTDGIEEYSPESEDVRYWSDFNRVFYHPRSLHMLPDIPEWHDPQGDWTYGLEMFSQYNQDIHLMETSVRLFLEECDSFQGMQVMNDTSSFGSFTRSFLTAFQDELSHTSSMVLPLLSDSIPLRVEPARLLHTRKIINDAIYLRDLHELSHLSIPIQSPNAWPSIPETSLTLDGTLYNTSALLSAHVETVTLPLRLTGSKENLQSFPAVINGRGLRFGQLSGTFPLVLSGQNSLVTLANPVDFSVALFKEPNTTYFGKKDVTRGLAMSSIQMYDTWVSSVASTIFKDAVITSAHLPAYPLPSSFPDFFQDKSILRSRIRNEQPPRSRGKDPLPGKTPSVTSISSLSSTNEMASFFAAYAKYIEECVDRRKSGEQLSGIDDPDLLKELANDLWTMHDGYSIDINRSPTTENIDDDE